ncbi:class IV adenylate cyclase [Candidatus Nomurabacteria bacterium]|nr:class IV adenylate cyclase [Candidatus Nomurabacteria bacterium]
MKDEHKEIEVRFLEIDKEALIKKLQELGAEDRGENKLQEFLVERSDVDNTKLTEFIRLRKNGDKTEMTYKKMQPLGSDLKKMFGGLDITIHIDDFDKAKLILENIGLVLRRQQEKYRHTFVLDNVTFDIDTWPQVPTYVEIEGDDEEDLKKAAEKVGLDWKDVNYNSAGDIVRGYGIALDSVKTFTFDKVE